MNIGGIDLAIVASFLLATLIVGFIAKNRNAADEYLLMGRRLTAPAFIMSLVCSWYGGILGVSEYSYRYGLSNWFVFGFPYYLHAAIFALFLARRARASQLYSIPDRLEIAYGRPAGCVAAAVIFLTTMPAAYLLMVGKIFQWMFGWDYVWALAAGTLLSTVYVYTGGLKSVVSTDITQFIFMYGGFAMIVAVLAADYGGLSFVQASVPPELLTPLGGQSFAAVFVWYIIASTALIEPLFYERVYAARSPRWVTASIFVSIGFWAIFDFMTTATGLYARALLPNLADPTFAFPALAKLVLPVGALGIFLAAVLAVVMSTVDSYTFIAAGAFGRDLLWKSRRNRDKRDIPGLVKLGLLVSTVCAFSLALASESIISLWHALGSVSAPMLLIPTLSAWTKRPRFHPPLVVPAMLCAGGSALIWRLWPLATAGSYPLSIEPIYVGLTVSLAFFLVGWRFRREQPAPIASRTLDAQG